MKIKDKSVIFNNLNGTEDGTQIIPLNCIKKEERTKKTDKSIHSDSVGLFIPANILLPELIFGKHCIPEATPKALNIILRQRKRRERKFQSAS